MSMKIRRRTTIAAVLSLALLPLGAGAQSENQVAQSANYEKTLRQLCRDMTKDPALMKMMCDEMIKEPKAMRTMCEKMMKSPEAKAMCKAMMEGKMGPRPGD